MLSLNSGSHDVKPYDARIFIALALTVTLAGPRQSGKTTLCRAVFPRKTYVNLEPIDTRQFALDDPRGFLAGLPRKDVDKVLPAR